MRPRLFHAEQSGNRVSLDARTVAEKGPAFGGGSHLQEGTTFSRQTIKKPTQFPAPETVYWPSGTCQTVFERGVNEFHRDMLETHQLFYIRMLSGEHPDNIRNGIGLVLVLVWYWQGVG
jgi:hypothetical protein